MKLWFNLKLKKDHLDLHVGQDPDDCNLFTNSSGS